MSDTPMGRIVGKWPGDETEEQITETLEQSGKCQKCRKLEDLLRWRDAWGEPPTEHGNYLVQRERRHDFYGGTELMVLHWNGKWPFLAISHWRPIGPLPYEGGE